MPPSMIPRRRVHQDSAVAPASKETPADPGDGVGEREDAVEHADGGGLYGEGPREVEVTTDTAVLVSREPKPPVAIRWVLIRDPQAAL